MSQEETREVPCQEVTWKEHLLMQIGASCYLKIPYNMKLQYKGLKLQNPAHTYQKIGSSVELTYKWQLDKNDEIIKDKKLEE